MIGNMDRRAFDELKAVCRHLVTAEERAMVRGSEAVASDPAANRYASEAGSLLATVDYAAERIEAILRRLESHE